MDAATSQARGAAIAAAAAALDAELERAAVEDRRIDIMRACAHGGCVTLQAFCAKIDGRSNALDEAPALALLAALEDPAAVDRAVRAVTWAMLAQRAASAWPHTFYEVLVAAREALPLDVASFEYMHMLGQLTACANTTAELDTRDGQRMQFSRESLEHVIAAATNLRPARRDMLMVIPPWTGSFVRGIKACDEQLRALEQAAS